jgi:hypothetical protein
MRTFGSGVGVGVGVEKARPGRRIKRGNRRGSFMLLLSVRRKLSRERFDQGAHFSEKSVRLRRNGRCALGNIFTINYILAQARYFQYVLCTGMHGVR